MKTVLIFRLVAIWAICRTSALVAQSPQEIDAQIRSLAPKLVAATVAVFRGPGAGSGVIVSPDGLVLTAAHVTGNPGESITLLLSDGREVPAVTLGVDHNSDAAMIQITAGGPFPFRPISDPIDCQVGDRVLATGHPGGPVIGRPAPVRMGLVTAVGTQSGYFDPIVTTATVISGDSGGPLFNFDGEVIGIHSNITAKWSSNRHVPMPAFGKQWEALLNGQSIGRSRQPTVRSDPSAMFDDPYAQLRDKFLQQLDLHADDTAVANLRARPRLLSPHQMQGHLDRWQPDAVKKHTPRIGLRLRLAEETNSKSGPKIDADPTSDLTQTGAMIVEVEPNSPAEKSGLQVGQRVVKCNEVPISSGLELACLLSKSTSDQTITLTLADQTEAIVVAPSPHPERGFFPMPVAGMVNMQVVEDNRGDAATADQETQTFRAAVDSLSPDSSVVWLRREGKRLAMGTVVSKQGHILTKASQLQNANDGPSSGLADKETAKSDGLNNVDSVRVVFGEQEFPVTIVATDNAKDLVLLKIADSDSDEVEAETEVADALHWVPIIWSDHQPATGALVVSPMLGPSQTPRALIGIVTQAARTSPRVGYEANYHAGQSRVWLGVGFSPGTTEPTVFRVQPDSPAATAGILEGDVITQVDGRKLSSGKEVSEIVSNLNPGDKVQVRLLRQSNPLSVDVIVDLRPVVTSAEFSRQSVHRDSALVSLSRQGGKLSSRRYGFGRCVYTDQIITPDQCGGPVLGGDGKAVGINIARTYRHRSLAIPAAEVTEFLEQAIR